jgi:hypothetical protein
VTCALTQTVCKLVTISCRSRLFTDLGSTPEEPGNNGASAAAAIVTADDMPETGQLSVSESTLLREIRSLRQTVLQSSRSQERAMHSLEEKVLTIDDVDRILNVIAMRRAMVLPWSHMASLMQDPIDMSSLIGKLAMPQYKPE